MKRLLILSLLFITVIAASSIVFAQGMMGTQSARSSDGHTAREEAEGKEIWEKLQSKQLECQKLTDDNYGSLGEYFMGQMMGNSHEDMNNMMEQMMGKKGEEQMHVVMGKRLSGCDSSATLPSQGAGFIPMMGMMQMMGGRGNPMMGYGSWNNMMGGRNGFGVLGWLPMLLFWILLILGVVALLRYLGRSGQQQKHRAPLDVLKERYAKGEIDKKEFEQMKKDLG